MSAECDDEYSALTPDGRLIVKRAGGLEYSFHNGALEIIRRPSGGATPAAPAAAEASPCGKLNAARALDAQINPTVAAAASPPPDAVVADGATPGSEAAPSLRRAPELVEQLERFRRVALRWRPELNSDDESVGKAQYVGLHVRAVFVPSRLPSVRRRARDWR